MPAPPHLILDHEAFTDHDLGPLKTGKEAEVFVIERIADDGRRCLLAHKRYRPRRVTRKGQLEALGFQGASTFVNDAAYRDGRVIGNTRDRRAVARGSTHGRDVLRRGWVDREFSTLQLLADAGVSVPYPLARTDDGILMAYLGTTVAAPRPSTCPRTRRRSTSSVATSATWRRGSSAGRALRPGRRLPRPPLLGPSVTRSLRAHGATASAASGGHEPAARPQG